MDKEENEVKIVWGGWSCNAGYVHWAYVCDIRKEVPWYAKTQQDKEVCSIGKKLFEPPLRTETSNPKNCDYGKEPTEYPKKLCKEWCQEHGYKVIGHIKMRTD
ncbi:hypothetical protein KAX97_12620 [candidate division WOR-3 bacterium]|nr:hypothetical protein [candidate division WOR-3 bacterium]